MRTRSLFFILLAVVALERPTAAQKPPSEYSTLLASLKAGNTNVDYARLRLSYMDSPERKEAKDTSDSEKAMMNAMNAKDFAKAIEQADIVLANEYVNLDAHLIEAVANRELGALEKADFHRAVFGGLVDSILKSGDGKSPKTAWVVISVHEEYVVLQVLGFTLSQQSLLHQDGHSYDEMKVKNEQDASEQTFYFNVDIPFKSYGF
jgi:hypothetical protein